MTRFTTMVRSPSRCTSRCTAHRTLPRTLPRTSPPARGQATTEFLILALVLVPLFIGVPLLGKYIDLMQTAEQASRYVAFEGAVRNSGSSWKADAELATEVRRRFFSSSDAPVKTGDVAGDFVAHRNPLWSDASGGAFIDEFEKDVAVSTRVSGRNPIAATAPYRSALGLSNDNLYTAAVSVLPSRISGFAPFDDLDMTMTRRTVLLADAWTGRTPASIRAKIEGSVLTFPLAQAKAIVDVVGLLPTVIFDPALKVGAFDWDVVPCDRLIGGC